MEIRRYWEIILRYKILIIALVLCASLGTLASTYLLTDTYVASAMVLVRPLDTRRVTDPPAGMKEKEVLGFPLIGTQQATVFNRTYAEIIQSRDTAKQIVDSLQLDKLERPVEPNILKRAWKSVKNGVKWCIWAGWTVMKHGRLMVPDPYEELIKNIKFAITASEIRDTYLVNISVASEDPHFAAALANAAARVFVEKWRQEYVERANKDLELIEEQFKSNEAEMTALMNDVEEYKINEGIVDLEVQIPENAAVMSHFEQALQHAEADIQELRREREEILKKLVIRQKTMTATSIVSDNPLVTDLDQILATLEINLAGLMERYTPLHPEALAVQAKIDQTRERLAAEEVRRVSDETMIVDPIYQVLEERLSTIDTKLPALEAKRDDFIATTEKYRLEVERLGNTSKDLEILERKAEVQKDITSEFVAVVKDYSVLATKKPEEIHMVSEAAPPLYPSSPIKIYYMGIAAGVSLIIGIALAFFLEYINIRIRTIEEAESSLALPVLATIPRIERLAEAELPEILIRETRQPSS